MENSECKVTGGEATVDPGLKGFHMGCCVGYLFAFCLATSQLSSTVKS